VEDASRTRLVALAVLLAISIPLIVIAVAGGGSGDEPSGLRVERSQGASEVTIYVEDPAVNDPETNAGRDVVRIECLDEGGAVVFRARESWPFTDTDGGTLDPHIHLFIPPDALTQVERCRLRGTDPPLEGRRV
jgi:hypothetical protein